MPSADGGHVAVCFGGPVVELLAVHGIRRRARALSTATPVGEVLVDQRVVCGIGNVYRCDALFVRRVHPWTPIGDVDDAALDALMSTAADPRSPCGRRRPHGLLVPALPARAGIRDTPEGYRPPLTGYCRAMTPPFPALHARANEDASARAEEARARAEQAGAFLDALDALLCDAA